MLELGRVVVADHVVGEGHTAEARQADAAPGDRAQVVLVEPSLGPVAVGTGDPGRRSGETEGPVEVAAHEQPGEALEVDLLHRTALLLDAPEDPGPEGRPPGRWQKAGDGEDPFADVGGPPPPVGQVGEGRQPAGSRERSRRQQAPVSGGRIRTDGEEVGRALHAPASAAASSPLIIDRTRGFRWSGWQGTRTARPRMSREEAHMSWVYLTLHLRLAGILKGSRAGW